MDKNGVLTSGRDRRAVVVLIRFLKDHPDYDVIIQGHGDRHGSNESVLRIGMKTAEMLKKYLLRSGVDHGRIKEVKSLGNSEPLCKESTTLCDQLNRRVALKLVKREPPKDAEKTPVM